MQLCKFLFILRCLDTLQTWEQTWDMEFNPGKCQVLHISRANQPIHSQYTLHGEILESVDCARYLGVSISKDLTWNTHIKEILTKANHTLGFVKRNVRTKTNQLKNKPIKPLSGLNLNMLPPYGALTLIKNRIHRNGPKEGCMVGFKSIFLVRQCYCDSDAEQSGLALP